MAGVIANVELEVMHGLVALLHGFVGCIQEHSDASLIGVVRARLSAPFKSAP